jgi:hypothetical protein
MGTGREMKRKFSLIVVVLLLGLNQQLTACSGQAAFPIKDSGIFAEEADLVWLDNQRVLFHGYKRVEVQSEPHKLHRFIDRALYLWNTATGSVEAYDTFDKRPDGIEGRSTLCVHEGVLTYINRGMVITGEKGQETKTSFPKQPFWYNPLSCRYYDTKPFWLVEGHQTIPLLEEHGYLDLGTRPEPDYLTLRLENPNPAIKFYSAESKKSFPLPIGWLESRVLRVHHAPFNDTYLLSGLQYYEEKRGFMSAWPHDTPHRVWWLKPDGRLEKEDLPMVAPLQGSGIRGVPVRDGLFIVGNSAKRYKPRAAGGYLVRGEEILKVTAGIPLKMAVSPDGCHVALVNDTYAEDKSVSERIRMQAVRLCQGE